ncbi:unnamed protein product [Adineta ricciae]|uniref:Uncharacterized protein n=1 Tax=Adineta ricciae TaxID=249248 RepID=A0A814N1A8_ADIRI|nr:unnamed protein product [Adineta ricciae]
MCCSKSNQSSKKKMGNANARRPGGGLGNYGVEYDPYYNYGDIANYGSSYQPIQGYPIGFGTTDGPLLTSVKPSPGALGMYGSTYPAGFNPILEPGLNGPKIRVIYVPSHIVSGMQNLIQPGAIGGVNPINPINPMMAYGGGVNPINPINPMMAYGGGVNPINPMMAYGGGMNPMSGGLGGCGLPPQMLSQLPMSPMGSNCCSLSIQIPPASPQMPYPMPCPPPMIQPIMSPVPMPGPLIMPQMPSPQPIPYPQIVPQMPMGPLPMPYPPVIPQMPISPYPMPYAPAAPPQMPIIPQPIPYPSNMLQPPYLYPMPMIPPQIPMPFPGQIPQMIPQSIPYGPQFPSVPQQPIFPAGVPGTPPYGMPSYAGLNSYSAIPNIGSNIIANPSGINQSPYGQPGLGAYGSFASYSNFSQAALGQPAYPQPGLAGYSGYGQYAQGNYYQPILNQAAFPGFSGVNQSPYGAYGASPYGQSGLIGYGPPGFGNYGQQGFASFNQQGYGVYGNSPYGNVNQPAASGYMQQAPYGYGQQGLAMYGQQNYNGYIPQPYGAFQTPPYGNYGPQPIGAFSPLGVGSFPQAPQQPPQSPYNPFQQQSYNYPGVNPNIFGGSPQFAGVPPGGIFPSAGGFSPAGGPQSVSFPSGTGRQTHNKTNTMGHFSLVTFVICIGLSMVIAKPEVKFRHHQQKRFVRSSEPIRSLHGQKQVNAAGRADATTTMNPLAVIAGPKQDEMACLAACHSCLQGFPAQRKKKDDDNCGPMCDCADRCFFMPVEQVGNMYNQISNIRNGRDCWWRAYNDFFTNAK